MTDLYWYYYIYTGIELLYWYRWIRIFENWIVWENKREILLLIFFIVVNSIIFEYFLYNMKILHFLYHKEIYIAKSLSISIIQEGYSNIGYHLKKNAHSYNVYI